MYPKLRKLLDSELDITQETPTELERLQAAISAEFAKNDSGDPSDEALSLMEQLAEAAQDVAAELTGRREKLAERNAKAAALRSKVTGELSTDDPTETEVVEEEPEPAPAGKAPAGKPGSVTASGNAPSTEVAVRAPSRGELARVTDRPTPNQAPALVAGGALVASADMLGLGAGDAIDWKQLATAMSRKVEMLGHGGADSALCASLVWEYPDERRLGDDPWDNAGRLDDIFSVDAIMSRVRDQGMQAIIAAGGVCDPVPVDYNIPVQSVTDRPVRDALPSFQATRGGIRFISPPTFAGTGSSATTIWTSAIDATATSATPKPVQEFSCPSTTAETVDAIPTRVQFSNMQARFAPEIVAANTQLALANAARVAEQNLLAKLSARSTIIGTTSVASFVRDLFALLELLAQGYRYRNRLPDMFPLRVLMPAWAKGAMRTDLLRELAHDNSGSADSLALADSRITALFAARGLVPNWSIDGLSKSTTGGTLSAASSFDWPDQFFGAQASGNMATPIPDASANSAVANTYWPKRLTFFLFAEGTFVFLDGGRIDLGIVRDSVLNNVNKYQTFVEPFEGIAKRGYESIQCTVPLVLTGTSFAASTAPNPSAMPY